MGHLQKEKGKARTISIILAIATIVASTTTAMNTIATPVQATTTTSAAPITTSNNTATTTTATSSSEIKLSPQPIYQEHLRVVSMTPINETHMSITFNGNGMLTLPNTTQTINTTHNGTAIMSFATSSGYGKETIRTENGETVTATVYEIVQPPNPSAPEGGGEGIVTAVFQTNSTGMLSPLNGIIVAGIDDMSPSEGSHVTLWRWENSIS